MSTLKTGALRGTSGTADSIQLHASNQSVTFPGNLTCSGTATGFGNVLQVQVGSSTSVANAGANTTWTQVGPTVAITPSAATSKILVCLNAWAIVKNIGEFGHNIYKTIGGTEGDLIQWWGEAADDNWMPMNMHALYYDSPNTTSEITYKTRIYCVSNYADFRFNYQKGGAAAATAQFIAIEIGA